MELKVYELELKGFDASTDETDHLIKWIAAYNIERIMDYCNGVGYKLQTKPHEIDVDPIYDTDVILQ